MKGKFLTFEGCEGVGKSKQMKLLKEYLDNNKIDYIVTREPGGGSISEQIRKVILDGNNLEMVDECEALLYAAARIQHINDVIKPNLEQGKLVICDRYIDSSLAYQGVARNLGFDYIKSINRVAVNDFMPDATIFLNLSPEMAFKRKGGVDKNDRVELSGMEFHQKVYSGYLQLADVYAERFINIDCSGRIEETHAKIISALKEKGII